MSKWRQIIRGWEKEGTPSVNKYTEALKRRLQEHQVDSCYSYVAHFQAAAVYRTRHKRLAIFGAVCGFLASGSLLILLANLFPNLRTWTGLIGAILGACAGVAGVLLSHLDYHDSAVRHSMAGRRYREINRRVKRYLILFHKSNPPLSELEVAIDAIAEELSSIGGVAPDIPSFAYKLAKESIARGEAEYSEEELELGRLVPTSVDSGTS